MTWQCGGTNRHGDPCESKAVGPSGYCVAHQPGGGERMKELGRRGVLAGRLASRLRPQDLPPLKSPRDAQVWLEVVGRGVATGRLAHREAAAATNAVTAWLRAYDSGEGAEKLDELRSQLDGLKKGGLRAVK